MISPAASLAEQIDSLLEGSVLVFGSLPPVGRDLDLLARDREFETIGRWLQAEGFLHSRAEWVRFRDCSAEPVDLVQASSLGLPPEALVSLFDHAFPLDGLSRLVRPAPHHLLLLLARIVADSDEGVSASRRLRIADALGQDPEAWRSAAMEAGRWRSGKALQMLRRAYENERAASKRERAEALAEWLYAPGRSPRAALVRAWLDVARRRRAPARVISFSGLDGAGKSSQAEALKNTLTALGHDVEVRWTRLEWTTLWENRWLGVLGWPARKGLALGSRARNRSTGAGTRPAARPALEPAAVRERSELLSHAWVTAVSFAHGLAQRRETTRQLGPGKVVICDRYTLDAAAQLRFRYGEKRQFRHQIALLERLSPRPLRAYFLDVSAETACARKADQYALDELARQARLYREECERLGVARLDGERPQAELCAKIAEDVWRLLD